MRYDLGLFAALSSLLACQGSTGELSAATGETASSSSSESGTDTATLTGTSEANPTDGASTATTSDSATGPTTDTTTNATARPTDSAGRETEGGEARACVATGVGATLYPFGPNPLVSLEVDDLTGDGVGDTIEFIYNETENHLTIGPVRVELEGENGKRSPITVLVADLNEDGAADLILGSIWEAKIAVLHGPLEGTLSFDTPDTSFAAPQYHMAMSTWFGAAMAVADFDADGSVDLFVSSPSYGEVICLGELPPSLFRGPFLAPSYSFEDDAIRLDTSLMTTLEAGDTCTGHYVWCSESGLLLASANNNDLPLDEETWSCWALDEPLEGATPSPCEAWPTEP